jgi:hypothetical protein
VPVTRTLSPAIQSVSPLWLHLDLEIAPHVLREKCASKAVYLALSGVALPAHNIGLRGN